MPIYQVGGGAAWSVTARQGRPVGARARAGRLPSPAPPAPPPVPLPQVMASGMTNSTARPVAPCQGSRKEWSGLRVEGDCGFVKLPSFGLLEFDWSRRRVSLQVRGAEAPQGGKVLQQLTISLDTCQPV